MASNALIPKIIIRFPTIYSFNGSSRDVLGLFEASLPSLMLEQAVLYRKYWNRKITTVPPDEKRAVQLARESYASIRVLIIKMIVEVARYTYGSDIPTFLETPKKPQQIATIIHPPRSTSLPRSRPRNPSQPSQRTPKRRRRTREITMQGLMLPPLQPRSKNQMMIWSIQKTTKPFQKSTSF